jgi:hypothetical protein
MSSQRDDEEDRGGWSGGAELGAHASSGDRSGETDEWDLIEQSRAYGLEELSVRMRDPDDVTSG